MNIIGIELEYIPTFHILPHAYISLGKSIWLSFSWLNLQLTIKHISCDYKAFQWSLYMPSYNKCWLCFDRILRKKL